MMIRVIGFRPEWNGVAREVEIAATLEAMQRFVGGYIEVHPLPEGLTLVCDEEANMKTIRPPVVAIFEGWGPIRGPCFVCRTVTDAEGESDFASVRPDDMLRGLWRAL